MYYENIISIDSETRIYISFIYKPVLLFLWLKKTHHTDKAIPFFKLFLIRKKNENESDKKKEIIH